MLQGGVTSYIWLGYRVRVISQIWFDYRVRVRLKSYCYVIDMARLKGQGKVKKIRLYYGVRYEIRLVCTKQRILRVQTPVLLDKISYDFERTKLGQKENLFLFVIYPYQNKLSKLLNLPDCFVHFKKFEIRNFSTRTKIADIYFSTRTKMPYIYISTRTKNAYIYFSTRTKKAYIYFSTRTENGDIYFSHFHEKVYTLIYFYI